MTTPAVLEPGLLSVVTPVLIEHEGEQLRIYEDEFGIPTIGVGFNMTRADAPMLCQQCGANYQRLLGGLDELTEAQSRYLLQQTTIDVIEWLVEIFPLFWSYSQPRQVALIDLGFNVGQGSFIRFKLMISAILQGNWAEASRQMLHSEWASQVGQRAIQDSNWIGNG